MPPTHDSAKRRLKVVSAHAIGSPAQEVTFDGWNTVDEICSPATGRETWQSFKENRTQVWHLQSRREAETKNSPLWRIHGKLYDLNDFVDKHPGGMMWLELTRGTDATQAVEAYHLDYKKVEAVLKAYYVRDVAEGEFQYGDRFTFAEDGFFRTLRSRLLQRLKSESGPGSTTSEATGPTFAMKAACTAVLAQFAAAHCVARSTGSVAGAALAGFFQVGLWGVGHNFMHQAAAKCGLWRYAMDMNGAHSTDWQISHGLSHHLDTNLDTDFEQTFFLMEYKSEDRPGIIAPVLPAVAWIPALLQSAEYIAGTAREAISSSAPDTRGWSHLLPGLFPSLQLLSYIRGRGSWKSGLALFVTQFAAYQFCFSPLAAGVHHCVPAEGSEEDKLMREGPAPRSTVAWIDGQEGKVEDFGAHQVASTTTHTVYPQSMPGFLRDYFSLTFFGYLNNHQLHHLFPGVDASRLLGAYDILEDTAKEFKLPLKNTRKLHWTEIGAGWYRYMMQKQVRPHSKL